MTGPSSGQVTAEPWPAGDRLFRDSGRWVGGDDAYSIPLRDGRRLWLFGDTFVAQAPDGGRRTAAFVHSSVAIQEGADASAATMRFRWREDTDGRPSSYLPGDPDGAYRWPGDGAGFDDGALLLFAMRVRDRHRSAVDPEHETLTFFDAFGWDAYLVEDPTGDPLDWDLRRVRLPAATLPTLVGSAGVLVDDEHLLAHGWQDRVVHLLRWDRGAARRGDLRSPEIWCGDRAGWRPAGEGEPVPTLTDVETEFTVHRGERRGYRHVQMAGLFDARLEVRWAERPQGPWSAPVTVHEPTLPEGAFAYAGKAHPDLAPEGLAVTYNTIPLTIAAIRDRPDLYRPRAVRIFGDPAGTAPSSREHRQ